MHAVTRRWRLFFSRWRHFPSAARPAPADPGRRAAPATVSRTASTALAALAVMAVMALLVSPSAFAAEGGVAQLRRFVESTPQATGRFTQTLVKEGGVTARPSSGSFAYARPGRFRWDIQKPYEQLIVTDGKQLHFYDKDLQQVTIKPVSEGMSATPAALSPWMISLTPYRMNMKAGWYLLMAVCVRPTFSSAWLPLMPVL